jgi:hypothetical protein
MNSIENLIRYLQPSLITHKIEMKCSKKIENIFYINKNGNLYFVAESTGDDVDIIFDELEQIILTTEIIDKLNPSDSYLIICWKHEINEESDNLKIVNLEENGYLMKKYIFSYSRQEYTTFFNKYLNYEKAILLNDIIKDLSKQNTYLNASVEEKFLVNILAKFPFMEFNFPEEKSLIYQDMVNENIKNEAISNSKIYEINKIISDFIGSNDTEKISSSCLLKNIEEDNPNLVYLLNELMEIEYNEQ